MVSIELPREPLHLERTRDGQDGRPAAPEPVRRPGILRGLLAAWSGLAPAGRRRSAGGAYDKATLAALSRGLAQTLDCEQPHIVARSREPRNPRRCSQVPRYPARSLAPWCTCTRPPAVMRRPLNPPSGTSRSCRHQGCRKDWCRSDRQPLGLFSRRRAGTLAQHAYYVRIYWDGCLFGEEGSL